jgi:CheY-like chemotaxis protein
MVAEARSRHHCLVPLVLIVDDNPVFRASARALLEQEGYRVAEAATGRAGIERACELDPDLVLLDIQLPDIDGFEVAEQLARLDPSPSIVFISARAERDYAARFASTPAHGFLNKEALSAEALRALVPHGSS